MWHLRRHRVFSQMAKMKDLLYRSLFPAILLLLVLFTGGNNSQNSNTNKYWLCFCITQL